MELKQIKELMHVMGRTGMKSLSIKNKGIELSLERETSSNRNEGLSYTNPTMESHTFQGGGSGQPSISQVIPNDTKSEEVKSLFVSSPMVGTFYEAPSPGEASFVKVGDTVDCDTIVCIIEAMKVMNEVKAAVSGVVAEILVQSSHPVEFGSKLFRVIPK